ncbi:MAG: response regulator [Leptospiraceae bacterium]|nr:response regulator [Leptospiraceae bacterium]NUM40420.1 response regulator [Leptospiraceae bacterium]
MSDSRILIVEDDPTIALALKEILTSSGYDVTHRENGLLALQTFKEEPFQVVVTDLEMPVMDGRTLIENILTIREDTVIIVQSAHEEIPTIIDVMKKGVYDYFIKPLNVQDFILKVKRATEAAELRVLKQIREKEKILRLENQMSWYKYKEKASGGVDSKDKLKFHRSLFDSLKTNFSQGAGFGMMVSLAEMISISPKNEKNEYLISGEIIELFLNNIKVTERALSIFSEIDYIISNSIPMETVTVKEFYEFVSQIKSDVSKYAELKQQKLILSDLKLNFEKQILEINREFLQKAIVELYKNAMKFSTKNSNIISILEVRDSRVNFSIINQSITDKRGIIGIPQEYQNIIFEPFFRLWDHIFEGYDTLDYGLGLTFVEKIAEKHNGNVNVTNLIDHSENEPEIKVEFSISIPLKQA